MEKDMSKIELLESINRGFSNIEKRLDKMATKEDLIKLDLKLTNEIQDFRSDFKSFNKDIENDIKEIKNTTADLNDTSLLYDKRIEKIEDKVFA